MGTFSYTFTDEGKGSPPAQPHAVTKAGAAAELRGRGLTVIAASLEGIATHHEVYGVAAPVLERGWTQTLDTDIVELVKRRYFNGQ